MNQSASQIVIQEVGPRDGFQIEEIWVETRDKVSLIDALSASGFQRIEVSSFVSAKAVPALRDAKEVFAAIKRRVGTVFVALVPNRLGAERALAASADELNFVMSASETHNLANMGMTREASYAALKEVIGLALQAKTDVNATVATAFGCPFEGKQQFSKIYETVERYLDLGATSVTLADTTGMANPMLVEQLVSGIFRLVPASALTLHFHNTRGLGLVNFDAAYRLGARRFDSSLGGLGGCPFAPGASGNICTEDLTYLCEQMGISTGIDLREILSLSRRLPDLVGHETYGQLAKAGFPEDLHSAPLVRS